MFEFAPLGISEILYPALVAGTLLAVGAALIIVLEAVFFLACRIYSRVADKLHATNTGT